MSATPIPRTLTMTIYGDMDLSLIKEKPNIRKDVTTYSKPDSKINEVIAFVKKEVHFITSSLLTQEQKEMGSL